jgi:ketosteroid isomerase-like protein
MSEANVEIVRAICKDYARGDYEAVFKRFDEEIEFVAPPDFSGGGRAYRGHEETRQGVTTFLSAWEDYHYEVRNLTDCGDEVLVEGWQRGRGRSSGAEVSESIYSVWTVRGGRAVRQRMFRDRTEALEAAGLSE